MGTSADRTPRFFLPVLAIVAALRLGYALASPLDLVPDEALYWDWGRQLDWCYDSKPPMIAWIFRAAGELGGNSEVAFRMTAVLFGALTLWFSYRLARELFGVAAASWAVALQVATPGTVGLHGVLTIDPPLAAAWAAALWLFWGVARGNAGPGTRAGLVLVLVFGMLTKQMMLVFPVLAGLFLAVDRGGPRGRWRVWALTSSVAFATALLPVLIWNARHGWVLFVHSGTHFRNSKSSLLTSALRNFPEFVGSQIGLGGVLVCLLVVACLVAALRNWRDLDAKVRYLLVFSVPGLALITLMSLRQRIHPNWPLVYYSSAYILVGAWAAGALPVLELGARWRRLAWPSIVLGLCLSAVFYAYVWAAPALGLAGTGMDPLARLRGWRRLGDEISAYLDPTRDPAPLVVVIGGRTIASGIAYYAPGRPRVYVWRRKPIVHTQYDLWGGPAHPLGRDFLFFVEGKDEQLPEEWAPCFDSVETLGVIRLQPDTVLERRITVVRGAGLNALPHNLGNWAATTGV